MSRQPARAAGSLEFAHARLCARFGDRPDEATWRRIEAMRDLDGVLDIVRGTSLAPFVRGAGADGGAPALEAAAQRHWRSLVAEVAGWMPSPWQPAVQWCAVLADLPALAHAARGESLPAWLAAGEEGRGPPGGRSAPATRPGPAPLPAVAADILAGWRARWEVLLPGPLAAHPLLQRLVHMLAEHARRFASAHPADAWPLRRGLAGRVILLFRRAGDDPAQAFAYLTLAALDWERLRAELVPRALLPRRTLAA